MIFRVSGIHDFVEKRVFQIHVFSLLSVRVGSELRHEPLHAGARGRFGVSVTSLDKRRTDDRHQDDARAERERAAIAAQKIQPADYRHLEGNHRAGVAHAAYDLGNERGKHNGKHRASPVDSGSVRERAQARGASRGLETAGRRVASYRCVHEHAHAMAAADNEALHRGAPAYRSAYYGLTSTLFLRLPVHGSGLRRRARMIMGSAGRGQIARVPCACAATTGPPSASSSILRPRCGCALTCAQSCR